MKKLIKSTEVTSVQSVMNSACYCSFPCGQATAYVRDTYGDIQRDAASRGISPYSTEVNE